MIQLRIMTGTANVRTIKMKTKTMMMTCAAKSKLKDAPKPLRPEPQSVNFATMTRSEVRNEAHKEARGSAGFSSLVPGVRYRTSKGTTFRLLAKSM